MKRSKHSLSHYKLLSCQMGNLVPVGLVEVLPGDTFQHSTAALIRLMPQLAPVMHPLHARIHHWFVPHRLVWNDWENFITGGPDGNNASVFPTIQKAGGGFNEGSLADYLGVPPGEDVECSALPFRGYQLIWNEYYRDQDLQTAATIDLTDGVDATTTQVMQNVGWGKDYFTTARPWEQKGPSIRVPIADGPLAIDSTGVAPTFEGTGVTASQMAVANGSNNMLRAGGNPGASSNVWFGSVTGLEAPLDDTEVGIDLLQLREAFALQRFEEARARYGSRYVEYLRYLGVRSSDARLQRPEYLGGGRQTIQFSEVLQTAEGTNPVGEMRGHGIGSMRSNRYRRFFEEHGYVFSLMSVRPLPVYMQGMPRTWNRRVKEDFFQVELQHVGQQEIAVKEVYVGAADPDLGFGFQDRYDEYRRETSQVAGNFRNSLDFWHMARNFSSEPALNATFVSCEPTRRIFPVEDQDVLYIMARHSIQARRLVARSGGQSFVR